jgi:Sulfotransferase family
MGYNTRNVDRIPLFLHIPKTGGTTLTNCIYRHRKSDDYYESEEGRLVDGIYYYPGGFHKEAPIGKEAAPVFSAKATRAVVRRDVRAVVGHFSFGIHAHIDRPSTYVTLLRDPVERVVSLYHSCCAYHWPHEGDAQLQKDDAGLEDFVRRLSCREADNDQTRRISGLEPEFGGCSSSTLAKAKDNLRRHFAVVGLTECFDETLILIQRTLGWDHVPHYVPSLVNRERPTQADLPKTSIAAVLERNQLDVELYRFAKELLFDRMAEQGPGFERDVHDFRTSNAAYMAHKARQAERT